MEINRSNVMEVVNTCNARPDKDYGQNFLVEPDICQKIVDSLNINSDDYVLEIGPGLGSLTHFLQSKTSKLTVVDIDERMVAFLKPIYSDVNVINEDIRKHDVASYTRIIGNLPYNITSEIIVYLLINASQTKKIVLMCQNEAYFHFSDVKGKEYGPTSVLLHLLGNCKKLFQVKAGSFYPVPKCGSTVFEINLHKVNNKDEIIQTYKLCKQLFLNRRKTILNNLTNYLANKEKSIEILNALKIPLTSRPEELPPEIYLKINNVINKK